MIARFEAPQASQRWDSPLFTVKPDLWSSMEEINVDCMASELKQTVLSDNVPSVRANRSTQLVQVAPTDFLQVSCWFVCTNAFIPIIVISLGHFMDK